MKFIEEMLWDLMHPKKARKFESLIHIPISNLKLLKWKYERSMNTIDELTIEDDSEKRKDHRKFLILQLEKEIEKINEILEEHENEKSV